MNMIEAIPYLIGGILILCLIQCVRFFLDGAADPEDEAAMNELSHRDKCKLAQILALGITAVLFLAILIYTSLKGSK